ncbi:beta-aspartyl-peptidase [Exiguobacterium flavidum]|uniref:beta-aspartyl-peptidase n=1 Tax=Exiguobacterium flavidum TaxID=2184695 RepID=UPI000DF830CD|nr:beta-aspartyl-peptidase [Exiguobacterium flavidum]
MFIVKGAVLNGKRVDLLTGGGEILRIGDLETPESFGMKTIDGRGLRLVPGLIDGHVHPIGGGGEGGFATRTPALDAFDFLEGGITTVVGLLGTDGLTRTGIDLLAHLRGYTETGMRTFMLTGSYAVPPVSITGSTAKDIVLIPEVIGVGEIAINDHRSTEPTDREIARIASEARVAGMLSGISGAMNVHIGDGKRRLSLLEQVVEETDVPVGQFLPTHINRSERIFEAGLAWAQKGGRIDFTTCTIPQFIEEGEIPAGQALKRALDEGIAIGQITMSTDAGASLPAFDADGRLTGLSTGKPSSLWKAVKAAVDAGVDFDEVIKTVTDNVAEAYGISGGRIVEGERADFLLVDEQLDIKMVVVGGNIVFEHGDWLIERRFLEG